MKIVNRFVDIDFPKKGSGSDGVREYAKKF